MFGSKVKYGLRFDSCSELITAAIGIKLIRTTGVHQSLFFLFAGGCCLHLVILQCISDVCILFGYAVYGRNPAPVHVENPIFAIHMSYVSTVQGFPPSVSTTSS